MDRVTVGYSCIVNCEVITTRVLVAVAFFGPFAVKIYKGCLVGKMFPDPPCSNFVSTAEGFLVNNLCGRAFIGRL